MSPATGVSTAAADAATADFSTTDQSGSGDSAIAAATTAVQASPAPVGLPLTRSTGNARQTPLLLAATIPRAPSVMTAADAPLATSSRAPSSTVASPTASRSSAALARTTAPTLAASVSAEPP